jgi:hypothetical protein
MVIHFDAIQILAAHMRKIPNLGLRIKILVPPHPDEKMLPWKELLNHEKYFPMIRVDNDNVPPSVDEIINFLDPGPELSENRARNLHDNITPILADIKLVLRRVSRLGSIPAASGPKAKSAMETVITDLRKLTSCAPPVSEAYIETIIAKLERAKEMWLLLDRDKFIDDICDMVLTLMDNARLHESLRADKPLGRGEGFKGTRHCELCLAAGASKDVMHKFSVSCLLLCPAQTLLIVCFIENQSHRCIKTVLPSVCIFTPHF